MVLLFLTTGMVVMDGEFAKVHKSKSCVKNGYRLSSDTGAIVCFHVCIRSHKSSLSLIIPALKTRGALMVIIRLMGGGAEVGGCGSGCMAGLKFSKNHFTAVSGYLWASAGFISITFDLFCWPAPITNPSVYITDRPATAVHHVKTWRFVEFVSAHGDRLKVLD